MTDSLSTLDFWAAYPGLFDKAARVQKECFPYSPEEKGSLFYALEVCGEVGELLNVCKKIIRTRDPEKEDRLKINAFPEEAADCVIAFTMLAQSRGLEPCRPCDPPVWEKEAVHPLLIRLAKKAAGLYASAWDETVKNEDISSAIDIIITLSLEMDCDLKGAVNEKLDKIAVRALEKHYD